MGFFDTVNGAVNPEKPLSMQHWIDSAAVVTTFAGGYGAYKSAVPKTSGATTAGKTAKSGANNVATSSKLNAQLTIEEANSVFMKNGSLKSEVAKNSSIIIEGNKLKSRSVIQALTRNGSNINDWAKMATQTFKSPSGNFQVHFYKNLKTGQISNYEMKVKFNK